MVMARRTDDGNGEPLERFLKRMILRWDSALGRIEALEKRTDHTMKYLLRREARDLEWRKEQEARWQENQLVIREILARLPKSA